MLSGDTLFIGGCGRFFEGTPEQMNTSLNTILGSLPDNTVSYTSFTSYLDCPKIPRIYPTH